MGISPYVRQSEENMKQKPRIIGFVFKDKDGNFILLDERTKKKRKL